MNNHSPHFRKFTNEHGLLLLAFLLGLALRFINLGTAPLSDLEAGWALRALGLSGDPLAVAQMANETTSGMAPSVSDLPEIGPQPGYVMLTAGLFALLGSNNFLARFWPALAGSLLVLAPYLFSRPGKFHILRRKSAILLAFGLAVTPGLVVASRTAGSPISALAFSLIALGLVSVHWTIAGGVALGLALLSGSSIIPGLVMLSLAWGIVRWFIRRLTRGGLTVPDASAEIYTPAQLTPETVSVDWKSLTITTFLTVLLVGSLFLRFPTGLSGWVDVLPTYLQGWLGQNPNVIFGGISTPVNPLTMLAALFFYEPVALIFGLIGAGVVLSNLISRQFAQGDQFATASNGMKIEETGNLFSIAWFIVGLLLLLIYPGRQVIDLVWIIVPLLVLAANYLVGYLPERPLNKPAIILALVILIFSGLFWFTLAYTTRLPVGDQNNLEYISRWIIMVGIIALIALAVVLVSMGWSWDTAKRGLIWGSVLALGLYTISAMTGAAYHRFNQPQELWGSQSTLVATDLFIQTVQDLSNWHTGRPESIDIVSQVDVPSLRWVLRNYPNVRFVPQIDSQALPSIIITPQSDQTLSSNRLTAQYRGQEFVWWNRPGWSSALPANFVPWFTFKSAPLQQEKLILWARSDLFPGGVINAQPENEIQP